MIRVASPFRVHSFGSQSPTLGGLVLLGQGTTLTVPTLTISSTGVLEGDDPVLGNASTGFVINGNVVVNGGQFIMGDGVAAQTYTLSGNLTLENGAVLSDVLSQDVNGNVLSDSIVDNATTVSNVAFDLDASQLPSNTNVGNLNFVQSSNWSGSFSSVIVNNPNDCVFGNFGYGSDVFGIGAIAQQV